MDVGWLGFKEGSSDKEAVGSNTLIYVVHFRAQLERFIVCSGGILRISYGYYMRFISISDDQNIRKTKAVWASFFTA